MLGLMVFIVIPQRPVQLHGDMSLKSGAHNLFNAVLNILDIFIILTKH